MADIVNLGDRSGKQLALMYSIKYALLRHEKIAIGSNNVDDLYERVKALYPDAKLTKEDGFLLVENEE